MLYCSCLHVFEYVHKYILNLLQYLTLSMHVRRGLTTVVRSVSVSLSVSQFMKEPINECTHWHVNVKQFMGIWLKQLFSRVMSQK